jgi:hypothetical protein
VTSRAWVLGILGLVGVALPTGTARADVLHIHGEHCAAVDLVALDVAVGRELALDPKLSAVAERVSVVLDCADDLHAQLRIEPEPAEGPLSRELDLSDEPAELRVKLVALSVAELIDVLASTPVAQQPAPPSTTAVIKKGPEAPLQLTVASPPSRGPKITVRAGIRLFADDQDPMPTVSADLEVGPVQLGLATAIGDNHRFNGLPYIVAITVSRRLTCSDGPVALCMVARAEAGFAGVSIAGSTLMDRSVHTGYGDIALGFEIERRFHEWNALAGFEIGTAEGLVMEAAYLEHLNGPFAVAGVGVKF